MWRLRISDLGSDAIRVVNSSASQLHGGEQQPPTDERDFRRAGERPGQGLGQRSGNAAWSTRIERLNGDDAVLTSTSALRVARIDGYEINRERFASEIQFAIPSGITAENRTAWSRGRQISARNFRPGQVPEKNTILNARQQAVPQGITQS